MSKRYSVRRYIRRAKRNAERRIRAGNSVIAGNTQVVAYTYTATDACTVKSIKLDVGMTIGDNEFAMCVPYVLVRVQEGYNANSITYPALTDDLYNPTQEVLISGIITGTENEDHKYNMIGRKLKAGDRLCLIFRNTSTLNCEVSFEMNWTVLT